MTARPLPSADDLTHPQHQGWACVWCGASLCTPLGGLSVGRARGADGSSIEVYACPTPYGCGPAAPMNARAGSLSGERVAQPRPGAGSLDRSGPGAGEQQSLPTQE